MNLRHEYIAALVRELKDEIIVCNSGGVQDDLYSAADREANIYGPWRWIGLSGGIRARVGDSRSDGDRFRRRRQSASQPRNSAGAGGPKTEKPFCHRL